MPEFQTTPFGDYVLQDRIGAGGMAEIFLAASQGIEGFEKRLVIKRILPTLSDDEQFVRMFIEEAKLCVALRHPNIVQVYDLGVIDGQYYIAMEYVDGRDLLKTLAACGKKKIGFPTDIALYIVMEALKGLEYAHRLERPDGAPLGIIHRDVSPSNLLLSFEGEVKIGDFGIAKASTREKTATGILKGKFGYMAPEQVTGAAIDHRADVFAVGIVLYELLTGHRLFAGKNDLLVLERVRDAVIDPKPKHYRPDLDDELEALVLRALACRAEDRFQDAGALHDAIHDYVYRSRAVVGPAQLARFMQGLFLFDPEEVARRDRVRLPPVPHPDKTNGVAAGFSSDQPQRRPEFGYEATQDERSVRGEVPSEPMDSAGDFDEKTPLLDVEAPSSLSAVVYISEEYEWGRNEDPSEATRNEEPRPVEPQPLSEGDQERTVQTDVGLDFDGRTSSGDYDSLDNSGGVTSGEAVVAPSGPRGSGEVQALEVSDSDVEAIAPGSDALVSAVPDAPTTPEPLPPSGDSQRYVATQTPDPKGEVLALRKAREADDPTDFDLQDEPGYQDALGDDVQVVAPTRDDMPAARRGNSIPTALQEDDHDFDEDATRTGDHGVEPAAIVERTRITPEDPAPAEGTEDLGEDVEAEPTVQFDSTIYPALRAEDPFDVVENTRDRTAPEAPSVARVHLLDGVDYFEEEEKSEFGTIEVEESDLPTAEVNEADLAPLGEGPEEGTEVAPAPIAASADPTIDSEVDYEEDDTLLRDDEGGELAAILARNPAAAMPAAAMSAEDVIEQDEDEASRTDLYNPVEEGMVAELAARAAAPARRRPLTGRRPRPVLLPADGGQDPSAAPRRISTGVSFGRRRSSPRRRLATRAPLSVVNPSRGESDPGSTQAIDVQVREESVERAVSTIPAPVVDARDVEITNPGTGEIDRANTGAGSLVDVEAYDDDATARRNSSGVTAALSEAAIVDEQIAELRKSSIAPRDNTTAGQLAESSRFESDIDLEEATQDGHGSDLRSAILRRQSRRRMVTRSFVLYDDDDENETTRGGSAGFAEDSEQSVPAISDAGQLDDEGASDLFGVLSVLDERGPGFEPDEEVSMETDARFYGDLAKSMSEVRTETPPPRIDSEQAQAEEFGHTSLGSLTPDDTGPAPMVDYGHGREESTASVSEAQVLSVSQVNLRMQDPGVMDSSGDLSGIELEYTDDGGFLDPSEHGANAVPFDLLDDSRASGQFSDFEEPTQEQSREESMPPHRPEIERADLTSGERPSHKGGLVSESFDFGSDQQARWRDAYAEPDDGGTPDLPAPVRPRSLEPAGVEPTASQLMEPEPPSRARGNLSVLRAVVERQKVARELHRGDAKRAKPTGPRPAPAAPPPPRQPPPPHAAGSVGAVNPARAVPSVGEVYPPAMRPRQDRSKVWNTSVYVLVALAIALAVAAAVSSLLLGDREGAPIPAQTESRGGLVEAPPEPAAPVEAPKKAAPGERAPTEAAAATDAGAATRSAAEAPAKAAEAPPPAPPPRRAAPAKPARKRAAAPAPAPKKRRRAAAKKRTRRKSAARSSSKATLRLKCNEPVDVRISTVGSRKNKTRLTETLDPGWYRVKLYRGGEKVSQVDVNLLAGQSVSIPCP